LLWQEYNPAHRYAIGADTGKGNGNDHSASVLIDFSTIPARQVGSYANNLIPADQFAYELKRQAELFGSCLIAPEKNSASGGSLLNDDKRGAIRIKEASSGQARFKGCSADIIRACNPPMTTPELQPRSSRNGGMPRALTFV
jgi:hypothetical protein